MLVSLVVSLPRPSPKSLVFEPCQLSCLGSSVGRTSVWNTECRGFESHLRQLSFFLFPLSQVSVFLSFFLSFFQITYVYMVQPLAAPDVPSFCLACFGTNNKFTSEHVLLRWQYILKECQKRNIYVLSLGIHVF